MAGKISKVTSNAGSKPYNILIGNNFLLSQVNADEIIIPEKVLLIVSSHVFKIHEEYLKDFIENIPESDLLLMDDSEENKNYSFAEDFLVKFIRT